MNSPILADPRCRAARACLALALLALLMQACRPARAALSINTANPANWVISNGTLTLNWDSQNGHLYHVYYNGVDMVDTTNRNEGLYMDNAGSIGGGASSASYHQNGNSYIDWWFTSPAANGNAFTFTQHFILTDSDSGFSVYCVADHPAANPTGGLGQIQYVFRISGSLFNTEYYDNLGLNLLGAYAVPVPNIPGAAGSDPGRNVQNAVLDLHGIPQPSGYTREFETKYDYCTYQYLHQADGAYGSRYGVWTVVPSTESLPGGPTHQSLDAEGLLIMECLSGHLDNPLTYSVANGVSRSHTWGPFYFHFNQFGGGNTTPAELYQDALTAGSAAKAAWDYQGVVTANGYVPSTKRGTVQPYISGGGSSKALTAWTVLSDPAVNTQLSCYGHQYWVSQNAGGDAALSGVAPGTYRLSSYVLGEWGEMRYDGVSVAAGQTTSLHGLAFVPENFGTQAPIWTIGTPDRSAHEFLHGHDSAGRDDREYQGAFNFWADFAPAKGAVVYNATSGPGYTATNNLDAWNYVQWGGFDPGLYAGVYNSSDDTTDGYKYIVPGYVGDPAKAGCPPWTIHFTTSAAQLAQGQYAVLSVALAATEGDPILTLNGHQLIWHAGNRSDAMVRSGLSGYTQWAAYQWPTADLAPAGKDNVLTLSTNTSEGVMYDALRFEVTPTSADPAVRGWHDYTYLYGSTETPPDDSVPNP